MTHPNVPFGEAAREVSAGNPRIPKSEFARDGGLAIVDQGQHFIAGYTDDETAAVSTAPPLIVFGDHTRVVKYVNFPFAIGADGVKVLQAREGFNPKFLYYYLDSLHIPSAGYSRHYKFLRESRVPQLDLAEQQRIAAILDRADAIRTRRREILAQIDTLTRSMLAKSLLGGLTEYRLDALARIHGGGRLGLSGNNFVHKGYPAFGAGGLNGYLPVAEYEDAEAVILSSIGARCGKCFFAQGSWTSLSNTQVILPDSKLVVPAFLWRVLNDESRWPRSGSAQPFIKPSAVKAHLVRLPTLELQREFVGKVTAIDAYRSTIERALAADDALFASLQSRAFRGEL